MATKQPDSRKTTTRKTPRTSTRTAARTTAAGTPRRRTAAMKEIPHEEIRKRAYQIFQARGGGHGQDLDDWLQAERELRRPGKR
jgi:hypothetical protein